MGCPWGDAEPSSPVLTSTPSMGGWRQHSLHRLSTSATAAAAAAAAVAAVDSDDEEVRQMRAATCSRLSLAVAHPQKHRAISLAHSNEHIFEFF